jgi:hypothetical protein
LRSDKSVSELHAEVEQLLYKTTAGGAIRLKDSSLIQEASNHFEGLAP